MKTLFNSVFENSLRIMLLLNNTKFPLRQEKILYLDFITCYSKDFGFTENINGQNTSKKAELCLRRKNIQKALRSLVLDGFVKPIDKENGRYYIATSYGKIFSNQLSSNYGNRYKTISKNVIKKYIFSDDKSLLDFILNKEKK